MPLTKDELRQKYPLTLYPEHHFEIYDEVDARVIAFFFTEEDAREYLEWKNAKRDVNEDA